MSEQNEEKEREEKYIVHQTWLCDMRIDHLATSQIDRKLRSPHNRITIFIWMYNTRGIDSHKSLGWWCGFLYTWHTMCCTWAVENVCKLDISFMFYIHKVYTNIYIEHPKTHWLDFCLVVYVMLCSLLSKQHLFLDLMKFHIVHQYNVGFVIPCWHRNYMMVQERTMAR